jgi:Uma2 family endonuclease
MPPQPGARHCGQVDLLTRLFAERCGRNCILRVQNPLQLDGRHLLLPDLTLLRPEPDFYRSRYPGPADTLLVVEVADTTLARDRRAKLPVYARFGIPNVWIVDLPRQRVHVFETPTTDGYRVRRRCAGGDLLSIPGDGELAAVALFR